MKREQQCRYDAADLDNDMRRSPECVASNAKMPGNIPGYSNGQTRQSGENRVGVSRQIVFCRQPIDVTDRPRNLRCADCVHRL